VRLLAWLGAAFAAATAFITWGNLQGFRAVLGEQAAARMLTAAISETVAAIVLVGVVALRYSFGRKGTRAAGVLLALTLAASVAVPLWVRGPGDLPVPAVPRVSSRAGVAGSGAARTEASVLASVAPRVRLILLDGASLSLVRERAAAGRLPNFGKMLDRGAVMDLATLKPTQAEPVWAAAATGKYSSKNGVRSNAVFRTDPDEVDAVDRHPRRRQVEAARHRGRGAQHGVALGHDGHPWTPSEREHPSTRIHGRGRVPQGVDDAHTVSVSLRQATSRSA